LHPNGTQGESREHERDDVGLDRVVLRLFGCVLVVCALLAAVYPELQRLSATAFAPSTAAALPSARSYRIMALGDSITRGVGQLDAAGRYVGWRAPLQEALGATGFRYDFVGSVHDPGAPDGDSEGHGGWTVAQLTGQVDGWLARYRPDIVLLHAGTNDITLGASGGDVAARLGRLVARIRADRPAAEIFVAEVIGTRDVPAAERESNAAYAAAIPAVVTAAGPGVHLVDQSGVTGDDLYDHRHPNAVGYAEMAGTFYQALRAVFGPQWPPLPERVTPPVVCRIDYPAARQTCTRPKVSTPAP
jgi:lysophospholipase L1-like esterase